VEARQAAALHLGHLQVVQLCDCAQIGLPNASFSGEHPSDELDGVVAQL
jgi:hypothetical protein